MPVSEALLKLPLDGGVDVLELLPHAASSMRARKMTGIKKRLRNDMNPPDEEAGLGAWAQFMDEQVPINSTLRCEISSARKEEFHRQLDFHGADTAMLGWPTGRHT